MMAVRIERGPEIDPEPKIGGRQNGSPGIKNRGARNSPMGPGRDAVKSSFTAPTARQTIANLVENGKRLR